MLLYFSDDGDCYLIQSHALSGWFLGPRAENRELFNELMKNTIDQHQQKRRKYWPTDPEYITKMQKMTLAYKAEKKQLKEKLREMNDDLETSTPVFSPRFQVAFNTSTHNPRFLVAKLNICSRSLRFYILFLSWTVYSHGNSSITFQIVFVLSYAVSFS